MKRRHCKGHSVEDAAWYDRNIESQVMVLLAWREVVAGRTTDSLQAAQFCSDVFLHVSPCGKVPMSGIKARHEAELSDGWLARNSNDLVHFLMSRLLGQGWPRISPFLTSNQGKEHCWKLMGYSATLGRNPWCDPTWGFNFLVVWKIKKIIKKKKSSTPNSCGPLRTSFIYFNYCKAGKIVGLFPMTDKEPLATTLVLAWSSCSHVYKTKSKEIYKKLRSAAEVTKRCKYI